MTRVLREVRRAAAGLAGPGVVAVSGGADSVALLRALAACPTGPLTVAHVNHRLRGTESDADEQFVRDLAAGLGLECRVKSADVATLGGNLEAAARAVRYGFFAEVAAEVGAGWVATGHTADDQAETVLHRIVRGTGIGGLSGIRPSRTRERRQGDDPSRTFPARTDIVRPLLTVTRADVLAHLAGLGQPFREDASNADPRFTRNRIRHELLPLLRAFNPDVVTALARLAEHAADAHAIILEKAAEVLAAAERPRVGATVVLDAAALGPPPVTRAVLRLVWEREGWPADDMGADAWDRACAVARGEVAGWDFPGGVSARRAGRVVQLARGELGEARGAGKR
ncbi:MAG: tRNA lysidine(34) synthetase TilS [Isosphaera sp.]|nr:tRNA lysidine(34) synthetase TilS [Isosphaera sp.]